MCNNEKNTIYQQATTKRFSVKFYYYVIFCFSAIKTLIQDKKKNEIRNKFLLAGDKFITKMHLRQKTKREYKHLKKQEIQLYITYIYIYIYIYYIHITYHILYIYIHIHNIFNGMHTMWKQYVGKAETAFNNPLNNHRDDVQNPYPKTILVCKHFREKNQNFNKHA